MTAMKSLNLRQAIVQRVQDKSDAELFDVIDGSVGYDERSLPGLGVLFEVIWKHLGDEERRKLVTVLKSNL